jgi:hypothetical protein
MAALQTIENKLADAFKGLPQLPESARSWLAEYAWVLALVGAVLGAILAAILLTTVLFVSAVVAPVYTNSIYVTEVAPVQHTIALAWVALIALVVYVIILGLSVSKLKAKSKAGWDLLFMGLLLLLAYDVFNWLQYPGAVFSFVWSLLMTAVSLYFLFQIREKFGGKKVTP